MKRLVAAFKSPLSGKVFTGPNHGVAFIESDVPSITTLSELELLEAEGFSNQDGSGFITRIESKRLHGFFSSEELSLMRQGG